MTEINLSTEPKQTHGRRAALVAKGEGEGVGWTESLELVAANSCIWRG